VTGRARVWALGLAATICGLGADARADKKKAGLFDIDWWKPPVKHEHDAAQQLAPQRMDLTSGAIPQSEARELRIRIYADRDYRATVIRWQSKVRAQISRVNAVIGPVFNLRFEIDGLRDWDRSHMGAPLSNNVLGELGALDDGHDVDLVIGLVTPLNGVATSAHSVGFAALLSRHFVLRGMDDEQEFRAFEREFTLIPATERQKLYTDRKAHKEVVVFLHEWGHTLGLIHHEDRRQIMNPAYDPEATQFSDFDKQIVALVIERRMKARGAPFPEGPDLLSLLATMPADEGSAEERGRLLDSVRRRTGASSGTRAGGGGRDERAGREDRGALDLPPADVEAFNRAVGAVNAGHVEDAWKLLAPLLEHATAKKAGAGTWLHLAELASACGALTRADEAAGRAGKAPDAQKIIADIESTRHRIALPLDATKLGVPPEKEPAYVAAFYDTARLIAGPDRTAARARLAELAAAFPEAPGVDVLTCDIELRAKHLPAATKRCEAALAKFKGATRAHYFLALIAVQGRREAVAEQHLRQAILLDPTDPTGWRALAQFYRSTGATRRLSQLANEHQQLLASPLPE